MKKLLCMCIAIVSVCSVGFAQKPTAAKASSAPVQTTTNKGARPQVKKATPEAAQSLFQANKNTQSKATKKKPAVSGN